MSSLHMTQKVNNVAGHLSIWNVSTEWPTAKKWAVFTHTVLKYTWCQSTITNPELDIKTDKGCSELIAQRTQSFK